MYNYRADLPWHLKYELPCIYIHHAEENVWHDVLMENVVENVIVSVWTDICHGSNMLKNTQNACEQKSGNANEL